MTSMEERYYGVINCMTEYWMCKYSNNIIKQDHKFIKKKIAPMIGIQTPDSAKSIIARIEIMHMISKRQTEEIWSVK